MDREQLVQILTETENDIVIKYLKTILQSYRLGTIGEKKYAAFKNLESYLEYVQAKYFFDLISPKFSDVATASSLPGHNIINYSALHLDKFHMPPEEIIQGRQDFFNNIFTFDLVECVVLAETEEKYDLLVFRKHLGFKTKRLLPYCIPAHLSKSSTFKRHYKNIRKNSFVLVSVVGTREYADDSQECVLLVTFEQSEEHRDIKLGVFEKYPSIVDFEVVNKMLPKIISQAREIIIIIKDEKIKQKGSAPEQIDRKQLLELNKKMGIDKVPEIANIFYGIATDCMKRMIEMKNFKRAAEYLQVGVDILKEKGTISATDELQCNNQIKILNSLSSLKKEPGV